MIIFPAIDLKDGRCVRLRQGDMAQATIFNDDPAAQARAFEAAGFEYLHLVDLNGAFAGHSVNAPAIRAILSAIKIPLQLGGGIRDREAINHWLSAGVAAIIFTDIARDGMMEGANVETTAALARSVSIPVIASGGVNSVRDIERLRDCGAGIAGVVVGRALYDGRIDPAQALMTAHCQR